MGLINSTARVLRTLPAGAPAAYAVELTGRGLVALEGSAMRLLASDADDGGRQPLAIEAPRSTPSAAETPRTLMADLLSRSLQSNAADSRQDCHLAILRQLLPDEARILVALIGGPPAPLVTVLRRGSGEPLLENASLIGRTAAVTLPSMTPFYVTRLLDLGLLELGPEDETNKQGYELVLAERGVRDALKEGERGKLPARVRRRTVRPSPLGRDLWDASRPGGDA